MSIVDSFERKTLFIITRAVALVCITIFLLSTVGAAIYGISVWKKEVSTKVTTQEIIDQLKPVEIPNRAPTTPNGTQPPVPTEQEMSPLHGYRIPLSLQKYTSDENAQIFKNQLNEIPTADQQAYLDELGAVIVEAEKAKLNAVNAINSYMKTKHARYTTAAANEIQKVETLKLVTAGFGTGLLLIALFSLVLVLLAIERNTRQRLVEKRDPATQQSESIPA